MGKYLDAMKAANATAYTEQRQRPTEGSSRVHIGAGWAAVAGAMDTITYGGLDEFYAGMNSAGNALDSAVGLKHPFFGSGTSYADEKARIEGINNQAYEDHPYAYTTGMVAGGLANLSAGEAGAARLGVKGLAKMATVGGIEGSLYGFMSSDGDLPDRLKDAAIGGLAGAGGGWLLGKYIIPAAKTVGGKAIEVVRWGKAPRLTTKWETSTILRPTAAEHQAADELGALRKEVNTGLTEAERKGPEPLVNAITGKSGDEVEQGALFSMRELLGDPGEAAKALEKRLGKLSAIETTHLADTLEKAIANGTQIDDPHFRSLLGFDVDDPNIDTDTVYKAIRIMEDGIDKVLEKAGAARRSNASVDHEVQETLKQGVLMRDLSDALDRSKKGVPDQVVAQHAEMYAGVQFIRAKEKYLPLIKQGVEGSREQLAEALTKAAHVMAMARGIGSNAGRAMQVRKMGGKAKLGNIADDVFDMESIDQVRERVNGAIKELGDEQLGDLIDKLRTSADLENVADILMDPKRAAQWSAWNRTVNSVSSWLRSNALTPATGLFNIISAVGHDLFRNDWAKRWAARGLRREGKIDDALALQFEIEMQNSVYREAHKRGLRAMIQRIQWDGWNSIEKIAGASGLDGLSAKARLKQSTMLESGYAAPTLREFENKPGIGVYDVAAYNQKLADRSERMGGGALAFLVNAADRAAAVGRTAVDEAGKASMKLFTGAVDDYGTQFVKLKETYAQSARYAIREAMARASDFGSQKEMLDWAQKRATSLAEMPPSEILEQVEMKLADAGNLDDAPTLQFLMDRTKYVDDEARRVLLQDGPQTAAGKGMAKALRGLDKAAGLGVVEGALVPYINTPIRILERGLVSYGPFAKRAEETLAILKKGGVEAEIEKARIELGTRAIALGAMLGAVGGITVSNGQYTNTANLDAGPPNRINLPGGAYFEIGRLDPFALSLSLGAMWGQAVNAGYHAYEEGGVTDGFWSFAGTALMAAKDGVLSKTYMQQLQTLTDIVEAMGKGPEETGDKVGEYLKGVFSRLPPMAGTSRQITESLISHQVEAVTFGDSILRGIPGGSLYLAPKRDILGDEVKGRFMGIAVGNSQETEGHDISPVKAQLRDLGIDLVNVSKRDGGVGLTSDQVSELRRVRGKEARNPSGQTMEEALQSLFSDPEFQSGDKEDKQAKVAATMQEFNEEAKNILESRSDDYRSIREGNRLYRDFKKYMNHQDARRAAGESLKSQGLKDFLNN